MLIWGGCGILLPSAGIVQWLRMLAFQARDESSILSTRTRDFGSKEAQQALQGAFLLPVVYAKRYVVFELCVYSEVTVIAVTAGG